MLRIYHFQYQHPLERGILPAGITLYYVTLDCLQAKGMSVVSMYDRNSCAANPPISTPALCNFSPSS
jgi:hypothetical protein